jgi:murein DD-endopeptidase MepM/ murein hydrolase activator NlpD
MFFSAFFALASLPSSGALFAEDLIHVVGKGDTIYSISRIFQVTPDELMKANGITDPSKLSVGKRLIIPAFLDAPSPVNAVPVKEKLVNYNAVKGDTLYNIAREYGITVQRLQEINKYSSSHVLKAGDIVKVPEKSIHGGNSLPSTKAASALSPGKGTGVYSLRWPVTPKDISYMSGQMGVVVEGERLETVKSLTQGNVVSAGPWRKFGRVVIVETSGGYYYMYGGCERITVNVGDKITPGMELGRLGVNAVSEKPQLFFMVFRNDTPIDPASAPRAGNLRT